MATTAPETSAQEQPVSRNGSWKRLLAWSASMVAAADIVFFALIREVIPPLAVAAVLTGVGLYLLRRSRRWGAGVLGVTGLLALVLSAPFAVDHLPRPESAIDFLHAFIGVFGRVLVVGAAVATWRGSAGTAARRVGVASIGVLSVAIVVSAVAMLASSGEEADPTDVLAPIVDAEFSDPVVVQSGGTVFIDNRDMFRHTFTVEGTDIDVEAPARQGVRVPIDLAPGTYEVFCDIPGHEFMTATLVVE